MNMKDEIIKAMKAKLRETRNPKRRGSMYRDEIIHFTGGIYDYLGELDQSEHPMGDNWYRIKKPCHIFQQKNPDDSSITNIVSSINGSGKIYRKFVDVRIPPDSIMEIRILDKSGQLYRLYRKEADRVDSEIIIKPFGD